MDIARQLSLRWRFMLAPVIGIVMVMVLLFATEVIHRRQHEFQDMLSEINLPAIGRFNRASILLGQNHSRLMLLLSSATRHQDEERLNSEGRKILDALHDIENQMRLPLVAAAEGRVMAQMGPQGVSILFASYRDSVITAIDVSKIDSAQAEVAMGSAQANLGRLLEGLLQLANSYASEIEVSSERVDSSVEAEYAIKWLAAVMLLLTALSAVYFSNRMSRDMGKINGALLALSRGDTQVELPRQRDPYLGNLLDAVGVFRQALIENERQKLELSNARSQLEATRHGLNQAQQIANLGSWELDLVADQMTLSEEAYDIFERDPKTFVPSYQALLVSIHPEDRATVAHAHLESVEHRESYDIEYRLVMGDGRIKYINERCATSYDDEGRPRRSLGTVLDVTQSKLAEQALQHSQHQMRTLIDTLPDLVWLKDPQGVYLACNRKFERLFGASEQEILGKTDHDFVDSELADSFLEKDRAAMAAGEPSVNEEEVVYAEDGHRELLETIKTPISDASGQVIGVLGVGRDITERKRAEDALRSSETWFKAITQQSSDGITVADVDGKYTFVNAAFVAMMGYSEKELLTMTVFDVKAPEQETSGFERSRSSEEGLPIEVVLQRKDGTRFIAEVVGKMIEIDGESRVLGTIRDISAQVRAEEQIRTLYKAIEQSPVSVLITDTEGRLEYVNGSFERVTGYTIDEVRGKNPNFLKSGKTPPEIYRDMWQVLLGGQPWEGELLNRKKDGSLFWEACHFAPVLDEAGNIRHMLAVKEDITERKRQEQLIVKQAHFDNLTGLPNRFLSLDRLSQLVSEAQRNKEKVAVMFLDLDDFKKINDTMGHETGDKLLIEAAARLTQVLRKGDTVGRLGGDEFIVLLGGLESAAAAQPIAQNLLQCFRQAFAIDGRELMLTASIGMALYPDDSTSASELLSKSDAAMYHSKQAGRNTYSYFTDSMNQDVSRRLEIEEQIHGAIGRNELTVHYQPQIDLRTGQIMGAEALLRWHNPALGDVTPGEFIPIAEQTGLIVPIGQFALEQALQTTAGWQQKYKPGFRIAVNLSPRQFRDPALVDNISQAVKDSGVDFDRLELEITEGVLLSGHTYIASAISGLGELGISIAMDDFGTGYSSLSYLRRFPFNVLKIDRSFISDITVDPADKELITAMVAMSQSLKLEVVAEGVETLEQCLELQKIGCAYAQGFLFSRAVDRQTFEGMLASNENYLPVSLQ